MRQITRGIAIGAMLLALAVAGLAATPVPGHVIETQETWTLAGSPYQVQGDIVVAESARLTIEPGVTVEFQGPWVLQVDGVLVAQGALPELSTPNTTRVTPAEVQWVRFTQDTTGLALDQHWHGIRFDGSDNGSVIQWAIIEFGYARGDWPLNNGGGLFIRNTSPRVENVVIRSCRADFWGGGVFLSSSTSTFRNNAVLKNRAGTAGGGMYVDLTPVQFRNLTLVDNRAGTSSDGHGNGIFFGPDVNPVIRSSILFMNGSGSSNPDEGYYNSGSNTSSVPEIRNCIDTSQDNSIDAFIWGDTTAAAFYERDFFTLSDSSRGVDNGAIDDNRWSNEPQPNGEQINMGAYGGTPLAAKSLPVARPVNNRGTRTDITGFASTRPGESSISMANIENIGAGLLHVSADSLRWVSQHQPPRFAFTSFDPYAVPPDSVYGIEVTYSPVEGDVDTLTDVLEIGTDGGVVRWRLRGWAYNPVISVDTTQIDFGNVSVTAPETLDVVVGNDGQTDLKNFSFVFDVKPTHDFEVPDLPEGGVTIHPGDSYTFQVICAPKNIGQLTDHLRINNNDHQVRIPLNAFGIGPIPVVEEPDPDSTDVLDFAYVNLNESRSRQIEFRNNGNRPLEILSTTSTSPAFRTDLPQGGASVAENSTFTLNVFFEPTTLQLFDDTLTVATSADSFKFYLKGRGTTGGTYFSGTIPNVANGVPEVWGANGDSVYVCAGPAVIPAGQSLTIMPGVTVYFESHDFVQVEGQLQVLGKQDQPVHFKPQLGERFGGLRFFASAPGTRMEWAVVDSGRTLTMDEIGEFLDMDPDSIDTGLPLVQAHGGGISVFNCSPSFYQVTVKDCFSGEDGGGIWIYQSAPTMIRCTVANNEATTNGGGVVFWGSQPDFYANTVRNNTAHGNGGGLYGLSYADAVITNSVIRDNTADNLGGSAFFIDHSAPLLLNDVLYGDVATNGVNGLYAAGLSRPVIRNSVLWNLDGSPLSLADGSIAVVRYSVLDGGWNDDTVIDSDPQFDPNNNFMPDNGSLLVDGGDPNASYNDFSFPPSRGTARNDMGLYGGSFASYWGGAPLRLTFFRNLSNPHGVNFVVNSLEPLDSDPTLTVSDYHGEQTLPLETIDAERGVWRAGYIVDESIYLQLIASGEKDGQPVSFRRDLSITLLSPTTGGTMSMPGGVNLTLPPHASDSEMLVMGETNLGAGIPDGMENARVAGSRLTIDAPVESWNAPAELVLPYDPAVVAEGREQGVSVWRQVGNDWQRQPSYVEPGSKTVHATVSGPGTFVVLYQAAGMVSDLLPSTSQLGANYPNPFNPTTTIPFSLNSAGRVTLSVYNILGQKVASVVQGWYTAGAHKVVWNGRNDLGRPVASGMYLYRLETHPANGSKSFVQTRKLVLMR